MQAEIKEKGYKDTTALEWVFHPMNKNVKLAFILIQKSDQVNVTCLLAKIPKEEIIPERIGTCFLLKKVSKIPWKENNLRFLKKF